MKTPTEFQVRGVVGKDNRNATFSLGLTNTYVLGSSLPLILPRNRPVIYFTVPLPENQAPVLLFLGCTLGGVDSSTFLRLLFREGGWQVGWDNVPHFPYEMFVEGNQITLVLSQGRVSTVDARGAYKVTHDTICKFLVGGITEDELFAEKISLEELSGIRAIPIEKLLLGVRTQ
jgi:hypothetical protein